MPAVEALEAQALAQPGAARRTFGIKFQCPACAVDGHDAHRDNACLFTDGSWGCAWSKDTAHGRAHWNAIGRVLGAFGGAGNGPPPAGAPANPPALMLTALGAGDFLAQDDREPEAYIEGILSDDGGGWLGEEDKTGKTWWMIEEASCLALGVPVCGRFRVPTQRRVTVLEEEDSPRRTRRRVRAILRGKGINHNDPTVRGGLNAWFRISVWSGFTLDNPAVVDQLRALILDSGRPWSTSTA